MTGNIFRLLSLLLLTGISQICLSQQLEKVLQFHIDKTGGVTNWSSIFKVEYESTSKVNGKLVQIEHSWEYPYNISISMKSEFGSYKKQFNGDTLVEELNGEDARSEYVDLDLNRKKYQFYPLIFYKDFENALSYVGHQYDQGLNKYVHKVKRILPDQSYKVYYIDAKSGYLLQMINSDGSHERYSKFKSSQGFFYPTRINAVVNSSSMQLNLTSVTFVKGEKKPYEKSKIITAPVEKYANSQTELNNQSLKKLALVIGNSNYIHGGKLKNPINDARAISVSLFKLGFEVMKIENASLVQLKKSINTFGKQLEKFDVGLFYYAGHGIQFGGSNYMIPVEANITSEEEVEYDCVEVDRILKFMGYAKNKVNIVILDACRNNPFERSWHRAVNGKGLAFMDAPSGTIVAYSTSPGKTADDGVGENGLYTESLLKHIHEPQLSIEQMFKKVRADVENKSDNRQTPWESTSLTGEFYFNDNSDQ